jgi:hypothetical protein
MYRSGGVWARLALCAALLFGAKSAAQDLVFDVLYIPKNPAADELMQVDPSRISAHIGAFRRTSLRVVGVRSADAVIRKHTLILLEFKDSSPASIKKMLAEALNVTKWDPASAMIVIAAGPSSRNLVRLQTSEGEALSVLAWQRDDLEGFLASRARQQTRWELYWEPDPPSTLYYSIMDWFVPKAGPMRVIWVSDNLRHHGTSPCEGTDPGCSLPESLNANMLRYFTAMSLTGFPLLAQNPAELPKDQKANQTGAKGLAYFLGGFALPGRVSGDGKVLAESLDATSKGRLIRLAVDGSGISKYSVYELTLETRGERKTRYARPVSLRFEAEEERIRWTPLNEEERHQRRVARRPPLPVIIPTADFGARLERASGAQENVTLALKLPLKDIPAAGRKLQVMVDPQNPDDAERPLTFRQDVPWTNVQQTDEGAIVSVQLPGGLPRALRVIVFDETTKWVGVKFLNVPPLGAGVN